MQANGAGRSSYAGKWSLQTEAQANGVMQANEAGKPGHADKRS